MGALAIFNGDRGPDDYSVGFNPHLPTSGQVGTYSLVFVTPEHVAESQSQPEQPSEERAWASAEQGVTSPPRTRTSHSLSPKTAFVGGGFFFGHTVWQAGP